MHPDSPGVCPRSVPRRPRESGAFFFSAAPARCAANRQKPWLAPGLFRIQTTDDVRMTTSSELLQSIFPGRVTLSPREVALAMYGKADRGAANAVQDLLQHGLLIPNLPKVRGRWLIPVAALGQWLDELQSEPVRPKMLFPTVASPRRSSWRAPPAARSATRRH